MPTCSRDHTPSEAHFLRAAFFFKNGAPPPPRHTGRSEDWFLDFPLAKPPGRALAALAGDTRFEESAASVATRRQRCHAPPALPRAASGATPRQRCHAPPALP